MYRKTTMTAWTRKNHEMPCCMRVNSMGDKAYEKYNNLHDGRQDRLFRKRADTSVLLPQCAACMRPFSVDPGAKALMLVHLQDLSC